MSNMIWYNSVKERVLYIDYIKALGICLVILYHCNYVPFESMFIRGMYAMCVSLFFAVNGYLMLRKEYAIRTLLIKNLKLLGVMFFWAFVSTGVYMYVNKTGTNDIAECSKTLMRSSLLITRPECNHLWFLKTIFVLNLINPIIYSFIRDNNKRLYYLIILMALWTIAFVNIAISRLVNPLLEWLPAFSVLYYLLGYAALRENRWQGKKAIWILSGVVGVCALLQWGYNWLFMDGPMWELNVEKGWITDIVWNNYNALFIVVMTIAVCMLFQRIKWKGNRFWSYVGQYSLAIYVLQTPVQRLLEWGLPLKQMTEIHHAYGIILPVLTLLVSMGITWLMLTNKYSKWLVTI